MPSHLGDDGSLARREGKRYLALGPSVYRACWTDFARGLAYLGRTLVQVATSLA